MGEEGGSDIGFSDEIWRKWGWQGLRQVTCRFTLGRSCNWGRTQWWNVIREGCQRTAGIGRDIGQQNSGHGVVLKEAFDAIKQFHVRFYKVLIQIRGFCGIGRTIILEKRFKLIQLEECGFRCTRNSGRDNKKGHLIFLYGFMEHCGWIWARKNWGVSTGQFTWCHSGCVM